MEITNNPDSLDLALARWRDSCLFYFKLDLAMVVATAAIISYFKLEGEALLEEAANFQLVLKFLAWMTIYALLFELAITSLRNRKDISTLIAHEQKSKWLLRAFSFGYTIQVLAHILFVLGVLAYTSGYVDGFMSIRHPDVKSGT